MELNGIVPVKQTVRGSLVGGKFTDAYRLAVANGFEGTLAEWLESLRGEVGGHYIPNVDESTGYVSFAGSVEGMPQVGPFYIKGPKGNTGDAGPQGEKGDPGVAGPTGAPGKDGADGKDGVDGKPGTDGKDGQDGKTPVRGTDYFTEADKSEMVNSVLSALPTWTGGSY